ncbi:MAG TPA: hypothetical protein VMM82_10050 [Spirochaetia bacterium]|nr:hypothetical protein [Spirochaetia bacterium]
MNQAFTFAAHALSPEKALPFLLLGALGLPLILQDIKDKSVSLALLLVAFVAWLAFASLWERAESRLLASLFVLLIGASLLLVFPGRLGDADVIFMSGMALLLPFWSLMMAFILGCVGALAAFLWLSRKGRDIPLTLALPFLPSLYWGGLTVMVGGMRI